VNAEIIEAVMGPGSVRAVAEGHEQAQEHVQGDGSDGGEAGVGGEVEDRWAHWQHELYVGAFVQVHD
jgi:hypothetical protein